jgi:type I restriction enzyme M protein
MKRARQFASFAEASNFIWSIADLLRGDYKQHDFGKVILPFTLLRRLDCVLADTKPKVLAQHAKLRAARDPSAALQRLSGVHFFNVSPLVFSQLAQTPRQTAKHLNAYIQGFSADVRELFIRRFQIQQQIEKLKQAGLLHLVVERFAEVDLHPSVLDNHMMGSVFEDLIRRFAEHAHAGEHFTPREVIRLMVGLLFASEAPSQSKRAPSKTLYDPACGTGGMLSVAEHYLRASNPQARLELFGQELNDEAFAMCKADMLIKAQNPANIASGNCLSHDAYPTHQFDYMLSNPPFGVEWKKVEHAVRAEHALGDAGRFGAGLPRVNDGSLLFLQHMISKMKPARQGGSRIAIVFNGSPLYTGDAGSGESNIRRWIFENDWLEAVVALPDQLFFNTSISTYVWVVSNRKSHRRKGKVQLIQGADLYHKMARSLGDKRKELSAEHIRDIVALYSDFRQNERSKIFDVADFGFRQVCIERPLRLNYQASPERIARLAAGARPGSLRARTLVALATMDARRVYRNRDKFFADLGAALARQGLKSHPARLKLIAGALSARDASADAVVNDSGQPEADPELRDSESVPLRQNVAAYVERFVKPHAPDAFVDESKTKIGFEIAFARYFYAHKAHRPLKEIEREIRALEAELRASLDEVLL